MKILAAAICGLVLAASAQAQDKKKEKEPSEAQKAQQQQQKMKDCNRKAEGRTGDALKAFMSTCMKGG
jgi:psiF repeat